MDDLDLDELERRNKGALNEDFDDDEYDDIDPIVTEAPIASRRDGLPVPDLSRIPQEHWLRVLRACAPGTRRYAAETPETHAERMLAQLRILQLRGEARERREKALQEPAPPPAVSIPREVSRRRRARQVSFRLSVEEHAEVERVAYAYGTTSARLARMVTLRAVRKALGET
jgi:hypothetical protein